MRGDNMLSGATAIQNGDKVVMFTTDSLEEDEAHHLKEELTRVLPEIELILVVGVSGVLVDRRENEPKAEEVHREQ